MAHVLIVNGLDHAFLREFGCRCNRCLNPKVANTSVSLVSLDDNDDPLYHLLFDVGMGVVDSLVESPCLSGDKARLDWLILSHWHPDHVLGLNRLCETWKRTLRRRGKPWQPISTWCRNGTAEWLRKNHDYEWNCFLDPQLSGEIHPPGIRLAPIQLGIGDLKVTPITVSHRTADMHPKTREKLYCCASFVIEIGSKKAVLLWDIDNKNGWIKDPLSYEQEEAVKLLSGADYLFIDCNTWSVEAVNGQNTGHTSFSTVQDYVRAFSPRLY
ncbi:MBL fold metallo-hydrolase [Candidatus Bipolaricaulota bacterium]|nr:MBL fold metallo-hydrolase [Candidatus Bipolaricaulota bacterium]